MTLIRALAVMALLFGVAACAAPSKFKTYDGPPVTRLEIWKEQRQLLLYSGEEVLKRYNVELGFAPVGPKRFRDDGKTPEGAYTIDKRNPNSRYHLSIGISYPNAQDVAYAKSQGKQPGGDIFIHGQKSLLDPGGKDWTAGCIAVSNKEIEDIYAMVPNGVPITIYP